MTHSRAEELNPSHTCATCGVLHFYVPSINLPAKDPAGQMVKVPFRPIEVTLVAEGFAPFKADSEPRIAAQVPIMALVWAIPGSREALYNSVVGMN